MDEQSESVTQSIRCLKCGAAVSISGHRCPECGYTLSGVRLYNPKHFIILAFLMSAMVPIFLAASNWGRLGDNARRRRWLLVGFASFVVVIGFLMLLPDLGAGSRLLGYLISLPIAWRLREMQLPVYATARRFGAAPASTFAGSAMGLGLTVLALVIPFGAMMGYMTHQENRAVELIEQEQWEEAVPVLQGLLRWNAEDDDVRFNLAMCHLFLERWDEAGEGLRAYLKRHPSDANAHAFFGYVLKKQGKLEEAQVHFETADRLDPEVMSRWFGTD